VISFDTLRFGDDDALWHDGTAWVRRGRKYIVNDKNLVRLFPASDLVTPFGWLERRDEARFARQLLLTKASELPSGRVPLYICPHCGDLGCGTITARIIREADSYVWTEFAREDTSQSAPRTCAEGWEFHFEREAYRSLFQPLA
jgi:hypothetical protein